MKKRIVVTSESSTGRNLNFRDTKTKEDFTRAGFVKAIEAGKYESYYVRMSQGLRTPVAKPNHSKADNLD